MRRLTPSSISRRGPPEPSRRLHIIPGSRTSGWKVVDPDHSRERTRVFPLAELAIGYALFIVPSAETPITVHDAVRPSRIMRRAHLRSARMVQDGEGWSIAMGDSGVLVGPFDSRARAQTAAARLLQTATSGPEGETPVTPTRRVWSAGAVGRRVGSG